MISRNFNNKLIKKSRLLNIYLALLEDHKLINNTTKYETIKIELKNNFDYETSLEDITNYYEPNFYENRLDVEQQMRNLGINYG